MRNPAFMQRGATVVEFALVFVIFLAILFAAIEFGRAMFQASYAVEATRRGARMAAIVDASARTPGTAAYNTVRDDMFLGLGWLDMPDTVVTVEYSSTGAVAEDGSFDDGCAGRGSCMFVRVGVVYTFSWIAPFLRPVPFDQLLAVHAAGTATTFYTTLPIEALGAT